MKWENDVASGGRRSTRDQSGTSASIVDCILYPFTFVMPSLFPKLVRLFTCGKASGSIKRARITSLLGWRED